MLMNDEKGERRLSSGFDKEELEELRGGRRRTRLSHFGFTGNETVKQKVRRKKRIGVAEAHVCSTCIFK